MTKNEVSQWDDTFLSTDDKKFYARRTTVELVYVTQHPRTTAIDVQKLLKASRAAKRRSTVQLVTQYVIGTVAGVVIVAACIGFVWGLAVLAWGAFG